MSGTKEGARFVTGGPDVFEGLEGGFYAQPTLFADLDSNMRVAQEEIFGPVLAVIPYDDEDRGGAHRQRLRLRAQRRRVALPDRRPARVGLPGSSHAVLEFRSGAGSMTASLRISQTVDGATFTPRTSSSPCRRRDPVGILLRQTQHKGADGA